MAQTPDSSDRQLARLLTERGLASVPQIKACLAELKRRAAEDRPLSLDLLLRERGVVPGAALDALAADTARQLACPVCDRQRSIFGWNPATRYHCSCGTVLHRPSETVDVQALMGKGLVGRRLGGKYQLLRLLGEGGMGQVYEARHVDLDRLCAVKLLPPTHDTTDETMLERFRREARATARLDHPNVVTVYDVGEDDGIAWLAMAKIDGRDLSEVVEDDGPMALEDAVSAVRQAAEGLGAAHAAGIVHRDVKPENLMRTDEGRVLVMDFGLAWLAAAGTRLSQSGYIMGTLNYMPPEQADGLPGEPASDIFSLGGTFYALLTGQPPFEAEGVAALIYKVQTEAAVPPSTRVPGLPPAVDAVVARMMAKAPEDRYPDMPTVIADLDRLTAGEPVEASAAEPLWGRLVAGLAIGVALIVGGVLLSRDAPDPPPAPPPVTRPEPPAPGPAIAPAEAAYARLSQALLDPARPLVGKRDLCGDYLKLYPVGARADQVRQLQADYVAQIARARPPTPAPTAPDTDGLAARVRDLLANHRFVQAREAVEAFGARHPGAVAAEAVRQQTGRIRVAREDHLRRLHQQLAQARAADDRTAGLELIGRLVALGAEPDPAARAWLTGKVTDPEPPPTSPHPATLAEIARALDRGALDEAARLLDGMARLELPPKLSARRAELRARLAAARPPVVPFERWIALRDRLEQRVVDWIASRRTDEGQAQLAREAVDLPAPLAALVARYRRHLEHAGRVRGEALRKALAAAPLSGTPARSLFAARFEGWTIRGYDAGRDRLRLARGGAQMTVGSRTLDDLEILALARLTRFAELVPLELATLLLYRDRTAEVERLIRERRLDVEQLDAGLRGRLGADWPSLPLATELGRLAQRGLPGRPHIVRVRRRDARLTRWRWSPAPPSRSTRAGSGLMLLDHGPLRRVSTELTWRLPERRDPIRGARVGLLLSYRSTGRSGARPWHVTFEVLLAEAQLRVQRRSGKDGGRVSTLASEALAGPVPRGAGELQLTLAHDGRQLLLACRVGDQSWQRWSYALAEDVAFRVGLFAFGHPAAPIRWQVDGRFR